ALLGREAVNVGGYDVRPGLPKDVAVGRHDPLAAVTNRGLDRFKRTAVHEDASRQVGSAEGLVALAIDTMAGSAYGSEFLRSRPGQVLRRRTPAQAVDVGGDVLRACLAQSGTPGRHDTMAAVEDAGLDGFRRAAVETDAVGQVGEADCAAGVSAVADRAVVGEQPATGLHGFRILGQLRDRDGSQLLVERTVALLGRRHVL